MRRAAGSGERRQYSGLRWLRVGMVATGGALVAAGCWGPAFDDSGSCESSAESCAESETCWPDLAEGAFVCIATPAAARDAGQPCEIQTGTPQCRHGLFCYTAQGGSSGICSLRCDPEASAELCSSGVCTRLTVGDLGVIGVCRL